MVQSQGRKGSFIKDFTTGAVSASLAKTIVTPIEHVKLLLHLQKKASLQKPHFTITGMIGCTVNVPRGSGILRYWRGNLSNVVRYFPTEALNFALNDQYKKMFLGNIDRNKYLFTHFFENTASGATAGITSLCIVYPFSLAQTRLAVDLAKSTGEREYRGLIDCIVKTLKIDGSVALYRGFLVSLQGTIVYRSCYFGLFDTAKLLVKDRDLPLHASYFMAQTVAIVSALLSYPLYNVQGRMMMQYCSPVKGILYKNTWDCWMKICQNEGISALYSGAFSNILRTIGPALGLLFYDKLKVLL